MCTRRMTEYYMPLKPLPLFHFEIQPGCHGLQSDGSLRRLRVSSWACRNSVWGGGLNIRQPWLW